VHPSGFRRNIGRLYVMGGTIAQFAVGKVSLPGHPHSRAPQTPSFLLSGLTFAAKDVNSPTTKTAIRLATKGPGLSAH
jgi:hypothetical protein